MIDLSDANADHIVCIFSNLIAFLMVNKNNEQI